MYMSLYFRPQDKIDRIKNDSCVLHLLTGIPQYQTDGEKCKDGISDDGLIFNSQYCGIEFTHTDWDTHESFSILSIISWGLKYKDMYI
jgi:hypothetical protein